MKGRVATCDLVEILRHDTDTGKFIGREQGDEFSCIGGERVEKDHGERRGIDARCGLELMYQGWVGRVEVKIRPEPKRQGCP